MLLTFIVRGHFARECRAKKSRDKNRDAGYKSRDNTRRTVPVETSDALVVQENALIVQDGLGYDWSYIAQEEPTEFALMAYTSNSSGSDTEKNEAVYEEKIAVLEFKVKDKILTRSGKVQVSTAKKSSLRATTSTSTFRLVNTATHTNKVNVSKLRTNAFHKSHSPTRRSFYKPTAPNTRISNEKVNTVRVNGVNTAGQIAVSAVKGNEVTAVKASAGCVWRPKMTNLNNVSKDNSGSWVSKRVNYIDPQGRLKSVVAWHMTRNKDFLIDYQDIDGGFVAFGRSAKGELKFNLFSVSQMRNKKNSVLFTETECLVLSPDFKLLDASQVLLRVPRLGHVNFKTKNKLVKGNLVRGLPSKIFENDHTCVACQKGKQHKASYKAKLVRSISQPLQMLHMDLFGPTSIRSINYKTYFLVVTDDFSSFSWVFFLASKDETCGDPKP
ncbi:ribonuclease H-like domain-containing protein [Tanacetum coccineum]